MCLLGFIAPFQSCQSRLYIKDGCSPSVSSLNKHFSNGEQESTPLVVKKIHIGFMVEFISHIFFNFEEKHDDYDKNTRVLKSHP